MRQFARPAAVVALLLCATLLSPAGAHGGAVGTSGASATPESASAQAAVPEPDRRAIAGRNNSTVQHVDPERRNGSRRGTSTAAVLVSALGIRLTAGADLLVVGAYDRARERVGPEFERVLRRYERFAAGNPVPFADNVSTEFRRAGRTEHDLTESVEAYEVAFETYREAERNGENQRARETARKLRRLSREINGTAADLKRSYDRLSRSTTVDFSEATADVDAVVADVARTQARVENVTLVPTRVNARANGTNVSAARPLVVTGRLVDENGTALDNRTIRLDGAESATRTETDANGTFGLRYRPIAAPVGSTTVTVAFVPEPTSRFARSNATLEVTVRQETPTLSVTATPEVARFRDAVSVTGRLRLRNVSIPDAPVVVDLGNRTSVRVRTGADGRFNHTTTLSAAVPVGRVPVRARLDYSERALAGVAANASFTVRRTETSMAIRARNRSGHRIRVRGQLNVSGGSGIGNQQVVVALDGTEAARAITAANGSFRTTVAVPPDLLAPDQSRVRVGASFDPTGTNLAGSNASTGVLVPGTGPPGRAALVERLLAGLDEGPPWVPVLAGMAVVAVGVYLRQRGASADDGEADAGRDPAADAGEDATVGTETADRPAPEPDRPGYGVGAARQCLDEGEVDTAIELAYGALRRQVAAAHGLDPATTHWEFYAACADAGLEADLLDTLEWLTDTYERAAFAPDSPDRHTAERYVSEVEAVDGST